MKNKMLLKLLQLKVKRLRNLNQDLLRNKQRRFQLKETKMDLKKRKKLREVMYLFPTKKNQVKILMRIQKQKIKLKSQLSKLKKSIKKKLKKIFQLRKSLPLRKKKRPLKKIKMRSQKPQPQRLLPQRHQRPKKLRQKVLRLLLKQKNLRLKKLKALRLLKFQVLNLQNHLTIPKNLTKTLQSHLIMLLEQLKIDMNLQVIFHHPPKKMRNS